MSLIRIVLLAAFALLAFAGNSLLARLALQGPDADPAAYTGIRLVSGAVALALILGARRRRDRAAGPFLAGGWAAAAALFIYAAAFSAAYVDLAAGTGALILFACVQFGILGVARLKGERTGSGEALGFALSVASLIYLFAPGAGAPDPVGAALMAASGFAWAAYTLIGRGSSAPLADTTGNFLRTAPLALPLAAVPLFSGGFDPAMTLYAILSGALASGCGYAVWYAVLPDLTRTRAALLQLAVPAIAALGGVLILAEPLTPRLVIAATGILGGIALAVLRPRLGKGA